MEHILLVLFVCKIINVFRCGRGVFGWSFLVGFASGVGGGEVLFSVCFPFAAIFVAILLNKKYKYSYFKCMTSC